MSKIIYSVYLNYLDGAVTKENLTKTAIRNLIDEQLYEIECLVITRRITAEEAQNGLV